MSGSTAARQRGEKIDRRRRSFLFLFPFAVVGGIAATLATTAYRFLRPPSSMLSLNASGLAPWTEVAPLSALKGDAPLLRKITLRHVSGWASGVAEQTIFVLPHEAYRVVSAVCPHEGCEVLWRADEASFLCPCHDSRFAADGTRLSGPARHGLNELPAEVENGILKVRHQLPAPGDNALAPKPASAMNG
ncbi:MAG: ubiquinol-cytochrome c reductase iron-sulfur subunit [Pyrinomonadaceae bacterium]